MPHEQEVISRETYWCPKWYWPFAVCTRTVKKHQWCYSFSWYRETGYVFITYCEGCERGTLYTWYEPAFFSIGSKYWRYDGILFFNMCFYSPKSSSGPCAT